MNLKDAIYTRRSVRKFENKKVSESELKMIVEAASMAPSWKNSQSVRYIAVTSNKKDEIARDAVGGFEWNTNIMINAPVLMVVITIDKISGYEKDGSASTTKGSHWQSFDAGIAVQNLCLAAHDAGLGSVVLGVFEEEKVRSILDLKENELVSALVSLGYPAQEPKMPPRKPVDELLRIM